MARKTEIVTIDGRNITLSNVDKVLYPHARFKKGQVIDYYARVSDYILHHLKHRPVTLKRYPDGVRGEFFYEKDAPAFTPDWVQRFSVPRRGRGGEIHYILVNDLATLVWVANTASLELHPFLHRASQIDCPTAMVYDLDPGAGADILRCGEVALLLKSMLNELKLECFVKVSGSKGLQLYVPLNGSLSYSVVQPFAKTIAQLLEEQHPDLIVSEMAKNLRTKKVFIDWSQNSDFKTTVCAYSLRAKADLPYVSAPIQWEELQNAIRRKNARSLYFDPEETLRRVTRSGDLFKDVETLKQELPSTILDAAGQSNKSLQAYRQKRDFSKTSEPSANNPTRSSQGSRRRFVIQKHAASHLHYDFRLEMHGVLKSWAVPKGPPLAVDEKRLAMPTEDHPLDYLDFEGIIPQGQYGGGTVMVWDIGTYELIEGNYYKGYLKLYLDGKKLKGEWTIAESDENGGRPKWYLTKTSQSKTSIPKNRLDQSVLSQRTMEEIAALREREWQSNRNGGIKTGTVETSGEAFDVSSLPSSPLKFISPMLAKPVGQLPEGSSWQYEIKLDGYRALALRKGSRVDLFSRRGNLLNRKYPELTSALEQLPAGTMFDGEIVVLDGQGRPSFSSLQHTRPGQPVHFYAFDILAYQGKSILDLPLADRRRLLEKVLADLKDPVRLSPTFDFPAAIVVNAAREQELEGIVAKRTNSRYEPGQRSGAWLKFKTQRGQELVVGGYLPGRHVFDSLLVGYYEGSRLLFLGKVRNGFTSNTRREIAKQFKGLETKECPFANLPELKSARRGKALTREVMKECRWLKPRLVAQVEFTDWTAGNHLRHSKFAGLRNDKNVRDVRKEV